MTTETQSVQVPAKSISTVSYVVWALGLPLVALLAIAFFGFFQMSPFKARDHFGQIALNGDDRWYMNFANLITEEMQDRDILYHGIGSSIDHLRQADIIILGHSVLEFGIDNDEIERFERDHNVKIYNLTNPGIASGQYVKKLIDKWGLKPKLWIINADDYPADFFNPVMDDFFASGRNSVFRIVDSSRFTAYLNVASRNIRWRIELWLADHLPTWAAAYNSHLNKAAGKTWRNIENGNFNADAANGYLSPGKTVQSRRNGKCLLPPEIVQNAGRYISSLGSPVVFTLLPYDGWCPEHTVDLATALGVEKIVPERTDFELLDGRHMNKSGARAFTRFFLDRLSQTYAFKMMVGDPNPGAPPAPGSARVSLPLDVCVQNKGATRLFASLRGEKAVSDHAIEAGAELRVRGNTYDIICTSTTPFGRGECPNEAYQSSYRCQ